MRGSKTCSAVRVTEGLRLRLGRRFPGILREEDHLLSALLGQEDVRWMRGAKSTLVLPSPPSPDRRDGQSFGRTLSLGAGSRGALGAAVLLARAPRLAALESRVWKAPCWV